MTASWIDQLTDLVGPDGMVGAEALPGYAIDGQTPRAAVQPADRAAVSSVMQWAAAQDAAVAPRGGGTMSGLGNVPARLDLALDLRKCSGVLDFQPDDLTVTVEAGMTLDVLHDALAQGRKYLPLEAPHPARATIGGILSTNCTGPRRFAYGLPRDWLIGIAVVSPGGGESKAGGRVVKNVTGYDLNKLYTGSLGTLGVIVEASFKLTPVPRHSKALIACFQPSSGNADSSVEAAQALVNQSYSPQGIQVLDQAAARRIAVPVIQDMMRGTDSGPWLVLGFYEGRDEDVVQQCSSIGADLMGSLGALEVVQAGQADTDALLAETTALGWEGETPPYLSIKINVSPSAVPDLVMEAAQLLPSGRAPAPAIIADPGFGTIKLLWWPNADQEPPSPSENAGSPDSTVLRELLETIRDLTHQAGGTAVVEQCPLPVKRGIDVWDGSAYGDREVQLMRQIKEKFDPTGVLNPGRFLGGI